MGFGGEVSVRRSVVRVSVAVSVFAASGLAWTGDVAAAGHDINVTGDAAKCDKTWGPPCFTPANGTVTTVNVGDTVTWHVLDGTHTVTPVDPAAFTGSGDLTGPDATFPVTFDKPGVFTFYCKHHGQVDKDGKTFHGMWGKIDVKGGETTTSTTAPPPNSPPPGGSPAPPPPGKPDPGPPAPPPPSPPPTSQGGSAPPPSRGPSGNGETAAGTGRPWVGPPPPTEAPPPPRYASAPPPDPAPTQAPRAKDSRDSKDNRDNGGSGGGIIPPNSALPPPDSAVLPPSPPFPTPTTAPGGAPQGDAVAVLKSEAGGKHKKLILFGTLFGVGAFVVGVGGWKFTHRASKYWPA